MRVWLDDVRTAPDGFTWAHSVEEAIELIENNDVDHVSFDYDMGMVISSTDDDMRIEPAQWNNDAQAGLALAQWMWQHKIWPNSIGVHSSNGWGHAMICSVIEDTEQYDHTEWITYHTTDPWGWDEVEAKQFVKRS